jgi:hypothetical protein
MKAIHNKVIESAIFNCSCQRPKLIKDSIIKKGNMKFYIGQNNGRHYEADLHATVINEREQSLTLHLECYEVMASGGQRIQSEVNKPYQRKLIADNSTLVDGQGNYLPAGQTEGIGEWDFFANISANVPVKVDDLKLSALIRNRAKLMPDGLLPE